MAVESCSVCTRPQGLFLVDREREGRGREGGREEKRTGRGEERRRGEGSERKKRITSLGSYLCFERHLKCLLNTSEELDSPYVSQQVVPSFPRKTKTSKSLLEGFLTSSEMKSSNFSSVPEGGAKASCT